MLSSKKILWLLGLTCAFAFGFTAGLLGAEAQYLDKDLEQGVAITDPKVLSLLEKNGFGITNMLQVGHEPLPIQSNRELSQLAGFSKIIASLQNEISTYQKATPGSGVGMAFGKRLFDISYLSNGNARFVLVGLVNRMDRAYLDPATCGETRLLYRLAYNVKQYDQQVSSRLPMTINLVFKAKNAKSGSTCQDLARAWLSIQNSDDKEAAAAQVMGATGPLGASFFSRDQFEQLELNLQFVRWPAAVRPDFGGHAEYLLKIFKRSGSDFLESHMENQVDRRRFEAQPELLKKFKAWLFQPESLKTLDDGTIKIPDEFLQSKGLSIAPGGINRSANRLFYGLFGADDYKTVNFAELKQIKSVGGLLRRLNESSCVGCHQTRAIGGFHFMGRDPLGRYPGNSVFVPGSGHFFGDLPRRREIVNAFATGARVDYSRGFSARPQESRSQILNGTGLLNGWGAHCSLGTGDETFKNWSCAPGLKCTTLMDKKDGFGLGICLTDGGGKIGDPCEVGAISTAAWGQDKYARSSIVSTGSKERVCSPQSSAPGTSSGGFLNGSIRTSSCTGLTPEAVCGPLPAAKSGFNACLTTKKTFIQCINEFSTGVGLKRCDFKNPCRDDYICVESLETGAGACVPPYFLFQFRVDGHPL